MPRDNDSRIMNDHDDLWGGAYIVPVNGARYDGVTMAEAAVSNMAARQRPLNQESYLDDIMNVPESLRSDRSRQEREALARPERPQSSAPAPVQRTTAQRLHDEYERFVSQTCGKAGVGKDVGLDACQDYVGRFLTDIKATASEFEKYSGKFNRLSNSLANRLSAEAKGRLDDRAVKMLVGKYDFDIDYALLADEDDLLPPRPVRSFLERELGRDRVGFKRGERTHVNVYDEQDDEAAPKKVRIARLLKKLNAPPEVAKEMTKLKPLGKHHVQIEISDRPADVVNKSRNQYWTSCENFPSGSYSDGAYTDVAEGNAVAIVRTAPEGRPLDEAWTGRISIRNCDDLDTNEPDIGIEPRMYGGNDRLHRVVEEKLKEIARDKGLLGYHTCRTDYEYEGYSDTRAENDYDGQGVIDFGYCLLGEMENQWFEELVEEMHYQGVCRMWDWGEVSEMYYEGWLDELLDGVDPSDYSDGTSFEDITECSIVDADDPRNPETMRYREWQDYVYGAEGFSEWVWGLPTTTVVAELPLHDVKVGTEGGIVAVPAKVPVAINLRSSYGVDDLPLDVEYMSGNAVTLNEAVDCFESAHREFEDGDLTEEEYDMRSQGCFLDAARKLIDNPQAILMPDGAEQKNLVLDYGDAAFALCAQADGDSAWSMGVASDGPQTRRLTRLSLTSRYGKVPEQLEPMIRACKGLDPVAMKKRFVKKLIYEQTGVVTI